MGGPLWGGRSAAGARAAAPRRPDPECAAADDVFGGFDRRDGGDRPG